MQLSIVQGVTASVMANAGCKILNRSQPFYMQDHAHAIPIAELTLYNIIDYIKIEINERCQIVHVYNNDSIVSLILPRHSQCYC